MRSTGLPWNETEEAQTLLRLFVRHSAGELSGSDGPQLIASKFGFPLSEYQAQSQKPAFYVPWGRIIKIRSEIDEIESNDTENNEEKFHRFMLILVKLRRKNCLAEMKIAKLIIEQVHLLKFPTEQQNEFQLIFKSISRVDYFLSYTNKDSNQINSDYRKVLYDDAKCFHKVHGSTINLLAYQIVSHLNVLTGFYDKNDILLGDDIREKVAAGAGSAFAFVQILTRIMFSPITRVEENWCHREYETYIAQARRLGGSGHSADLVIFLMAEMTAIVDNPPARALRPFAEPRDEYKEWYQRACDLAIENLEHRSQIGLKRQIEIVSLRIGKFRDEILDKILLDRVGLNNNQKIFS